MDLTTIITAIISSSLIATVLSSIVNYYLKKQDFKNEYFKLLLKKRMDSYEWIENQIALLKSSVLDSDGKPYHQVFSYGYEEYLKHLQSAQIANSYNIWLNQKTNDKWIKILQIFNKISFEYNITDDEQLVNAGKKYYWDIANLRDELENLTRNDLLKLYDFKDIKRKNSKPDGFQKIEITKEK
jgi:hypothetical protein